MIRICVAGATGWTGSAVTKAILNSSEFELTGAIARRGVGEDIGTVLGLGQTGVAISNDVADALSRKTDVLIDYTDPESVKRRAMDSLNRGLRVVIGTSGLTAAKYLPSREIIDYADAAKPDAPSGTTRELAEELGSIRANTRTVEIDDTIGRKEVRGAGIAGTRSRMSPGRSWPLGRL